MPIIVDPVITPGSGLVLRAIYINDAADPADFVAFTNAGDTVTPRTSVSGEARRLANRIRLIRTGSGDALTAESYDLTLRMVTMQQAAWLRDKTGQLVCVRDHAGTKVYGAWMETPREVPTQFPDRQVVKLQLQQVTFSEAV